MYIYCQRTALSSDCINQIIKLTFFCFQFYIFIMTRMRVTAGKYLSAGINRFGHSKTEL